MSPKERQLRKQLYAERRAHKEALLTQKAFFEETITDLEKDHLNRLKSLDIMGQNFDKVQKNLLLLMEENEKLRGGRIPFQQPMPDTIPISINGHQVKWWQFWKR